MQESGKPDGDRRAFDRRVAYLAWKSRQEATEVRLQPDIRARPRNGTARRVASDCDPLRRA